MTFLELQPASTGAGVISAYLCALCLKWIIRTFQNLHNAIRILTSLQKIGHYTHMTISMSKESSVAGTEVVSARLAIRRFYETVLGTLAIAGKEEPALPAIAVQRVPLVLPELALLFGCHKIDHGRLQDISQIAAGLYEVVA
jgi:hypothetical protein